MTDRDELHLLTGAYALNALSDSERADLEIYLAESEEARTEVTELSDTAVMLGLASTPVAPSPELKSNLMALIAATPQLTAATPSGGRTDAAPRLAAVAPLPEAHAASPSAAEQEKIHRIAAGPAEARAQARWYRRPLTLLVAAAAAAALFAGGAIAGQQFSDSSYQQAMAEAATLAELTAASDVERSVSDVSGGGTATLVWSESMQRSAMMFDGLPDLSGDRVYQLWYLGDEGAVSAGIVQGSSDSDWRVLEGSMGGASAVGVTVEPQGGSEQPTTEPIVVIDET